MLKSMPEFAKLASASVLAYVLFALLEAQRGESTCWCWHAMMKAFPCVVLAAGSWGQGCRAKVASLAFFLSAAGDFFLAQDDLAPRGKGKAAPAVEPFLLGLLAFLGSQWCFVYCFNKKGASGKSAASAKDKSPLELALVTACYAYAGVMFQTFKPKLEQDMLAPVFLYNVSLSTMLASSISHFFEARRSKAKGAMLGLLGGLSFVASDSYLALNMFLQPMPHAKLVILSTYFVAQVLLAMTFAT